jgi:hypothetical protein
MNSLRDMTDEQIEAHQRRVREGRRGGGAAKSENAPQPKPEPAKAAARASVIAVGRTARGVMNKTEARYASEILDVRKALGEVAEYWYESVKLRLADGSWFTVDFFVMLADGRLEAHEVKGHWRTAERVRIKVAAERYPFIFTSAQRRKKKEGGGWKVESF